MPQKMSYVRDSTPLFHYGFRQKRHVPSRQFRVTMPLNRVTMAFMPFIMRILTVPVVGVEKEGLHNKWSTGIPLQGAPVNRTTLRTKTQSRGVADILNSVRFWMDTLP